MNTMKRAVVGIPTTEEGEVIPTQEQLEIARDYCIPSRQAKTINIEKYKRYVTYLRSGEARLEKWLDDLAEDRQKFMELERGIKD